MARQPRLVIPGVAMHVRQRGHNGGPCFLTGRDRLVYLVMLRQSLESSGCALHAYCLMTNHVHLLLTPADAEGCSILMRQLGQQYVQYFNRRHKRSGTLWGGRFDSCLVDSAAYVLACHRYIERNPVRAGMVSAPEAYAWSSYRAYMGVASRTWLTPHAEYLGLAATEDRRRAAYASMFELTESPTFAAALREATKSGYGLVGEALRARLVAQGVRLEHGKSGRPWLKQSENPGAAGETAALVF